MQKCNITMKLPFIGNNSISLKKKLMKLFSSAFPCANLTVVFKSGTKIGHLIKFEDSVTFAIRSISFINSIVKLVQLFISVRHTSVCLIELKMRLI